MLSRIVLKIRAFISVFQQVSGQFKKQYAFELKKFSTCAKTLKHLVDIKIIGKNQSILCLAEEVVTDNNFVMGFSPVDVRTITYLAASDKYESILRDEKIKKSYDIVRAQNINGKKAVMIRNVLTGDSVVMPLQGLDNQEIIENLKSKDAFYLGYLAGQEKSFDDFSKLRLRLSEKNSSNPNDR